MTDLDPRDAIEACRAAHKRLIATASGVDDETARQPSRLPNWTVGHLLTHIARNADGHVRRLEGALRGADVPRYLHGSDQRNQEIEEGAARPAGELLADLADSARRLEDTWDRSVRAGWPNSEFLGSDKFPTPGSPLRRLREVEVHHTDLALGYEPADWPDFYVDWELAQALKRLPQRLSGNADPRRLLAWLTGRSAVPADVELGPWM